MQQKTKKAFFFLRIFGLRGPVISESIFAKKKVYLHRSTRRPAILTASCLTQTALFGGERLLIPTKRRGLTR